MKVHERFINYAKIDTTSDASQTVCPTSPGQMELARLLEGELKELGLRTSLSEDGYLFGHLDANTDKEVYHLGFLAHLDTAPDAPGKDVNPQIIRYEGGDIVLESGLVMKPEVFPNLNNYLGQELIVTDGRTLLGADNKAGIAEIVDAIKRIKDQGLEHGPISVAFTPDEEIGRGPHRFNVEAFGADFAYTIDGGPLGELEYENFNAAGAEVDFTGVSVHPGSAKNQMVNALNMAMEFETALPKYEKPWYTENYEGFYLLTSLSGGIGQAKSNYIIRDHDMNRFLDKKAYMEKLVEEMRNKYGQDKLSLKMEDSYYNMKEKVEPVIFVVDYAKEAIINQGLNPIVKAIRGGTDGAQLSFKGLPCPNIFSGGENYHGPYEFISIEAMNKAVDVIVEIVKIYLEKGKN